MVQMLTEACANQRQHTPGGARICARVTANLTFNANCILEFPKTWVKNCQFPRLVFHLSSRSNDRVLTRTLRFLILWK